MRDRDGLAQATELRHLRRLRDPHRLGGGRLPGVQEGGRPRRVHDREGPDHPALPRDLAGDRGRLLRALRRGPTPYRAGYRQAHRLAAGVLALGLPARLGAALAAVQGDQRAAEEVQLEVPDRPGLEHRRQAAGPDAAAHPARLRSRRHRAAGALLQARPRALQGVRAPHRRQEGLGPRRQQLLPRRRAVREAEGACDLGQPGQGAARAQPEEADRGGQDPPRGGQAARPLRVQALHPDVVVCVSAIWQTTCTLIHGGDETFVVDSPVLPEELEALPAVLAQAGWECSGLLTTHADWDHLLGRLAFPGAALGCAESSARRLQEEPGGAQRKLRDFDSEHYVERGPLSLGQVQALPVPGKLEVGDMEIELHPAEGHTDDGMALWAPWAEVLVCGDYLSPVERPMVGGDAAEYA